MSRGHECDTTAALARDALADVQLVAQLRSAFQEAQVVMGRTLASANLTEQRYHLLLAVANCGAEGATQGALARALHCPDSRVSLLVRTLSDAGFIDTIRDGSDRRVVRVHLTPRGEQVLAETITVQRSALQSMIKTLDVAEVTRLSELVARTYLGLDLSVRVKPAR
ncbi:MAG: MarR family winged helix-turn-helix transcriptional regulator [Candidatus Dormibacteria bacterium]